MSQLKALLFDLDGVIVDTAIFHYQAWKRLANSLGFDISEAFNERLKGVSRTESLTIILQHGGVILSEEKKEKLAAQKNEWYLQLIRAMTPADVLPGVTEFFRQIKTARLKTALGSVSKNAVQILEQIGMLSDFDAIIDGTKISRGKPDPEVFLKGAQALLVQPSECVVFEDAVAGIEAGKRAGMFTIGIGSPQILTQADLVVPTLEGLHLERIKSVFQPNNAEA